MVREATLAVARLGAVSPHTRVAVTGFSGPGSGHGPVTLCDKADIPRSGSPRSFPRMTDTLKLYLVIAVALLSLPAVLTAHEEGGAVENGILTILAAVPGGPAEAAGLEAGDRLLSVAGESVETLDDLAKVTAKHKAGDEVSVTVERTGEPLELELTFGDREGSPSLGVSLAVMSPEGAEEFMKAQTDGLDADGCLAWVDETYQLSSVAGALDFDLGNQAESLRACMRKDLDRMPGRIPQRWCDNVFKVHCSGLDLLTTMGEAQVSWCEGALEDALGIDLRKTKAWTTCAENKVFERFSIDGKPSDAAACRTALYECGFDSTAGSPRQGSPR